MDQAVNTKFLVFSVTHADGRITEKLLDIETRVDVAIHCGDLTEESKLDEYRSALHLLKGVNAHLKLVIAGNHDWALDKPTYEHHAAEYQRLYEEDPELFARTYGNGGEARALFESPKPRKLGLSSSMKAPMS